MSKTILGASTGFFYDGANPVQELSGTTPTANLLTGGVDEYFTRTDASGARNFLTDALGSTLALTDSTGTMQTQYGYDPFGNTTQSGTSTTNSLAYTGRENDGTGLYYYRARYYSPTFGRFVSEDPLGFGGGDTNLYGYVFESPTNLVDPFGLSAGGGGSGGSSMAGRACGCGSGFPPPPVPPAPLGTSVDFNIALTQHAMRDIGGDYTGTQLAWFYDMVQTGNAWDYKQQGDNYTDFGNFNYGATCGTMGWSLPFCQSAAGLAHDYRAHNLGVPLGKGIPFLFPPYGDQVDDQAQIANGYYYQLWKQICN